MTGEHQFKNLNTKEIHDQNMPDFFIKKVSVVRLMIEELKDL